jgi:hypothetical protein
MISRYTQLPLLVPFGQTGPNLIYVMRHIVGPKTQSYYTLDGFGNRTLYKQMVNIFKEFTKITRGVPSPLPLYHIVFG